MSTSEGDTTGAGQWIRALAADLSRYRQRPCRLFVSRHLVHADLLAVPAALDKERGETLDVIVASPGGDAEAAYLVARELRRRFQRLTIFVPFQAKSAATVLCLVADELVLGSLGELGPLDQQYDEKQKADSPQSMSRLVLFRALQQLRHEATGMYEDLVARIGSKSGMRLFDACSKAAELTSALYGPLYGQIDPGRLAESARGLEVGGEYAERLLKRYRAAFWAEQGPKLLDRLIHAYPTHGFIIDQEEAQDLGLPTRAPDREETALLDRLAVALIKFGTDLDLIALAGQPTAVPATAQRGQDNNRKQRGASSLGRPRRHSKRDEMGQQDDSP